MPRKSRYQYLSKYFHVMVQGFNKSYIFSNEQDIKYYIKLMYNLKNDYQLNIISYCIMGNHAHILIRLESISTLSIYMQRLNTKFALYYNKKYNHTGYVFRNRYHAEPIQNDVHLLNCIEYIYNNPVHASICNNAIEYKYSNYYEIPQEYITNKYIFIDTNYNKKTLNNLIIQNYLEENNINIENIKNDTQKLREIVLTLKSKYNVSLRRIAEVTKLNREIIRKLYTNN